jgi:hypothetical protein
LDTRKNFKYKITSRCEQQAQYKLHIIASPKTATIYRKSLPNLIDIVTYPLTPVASKTIASTELLLSPHHPPSMPRGGGNRWQDLIGHEKGTILGSPATTYIAPLKINLGQWRAPEEDQHGTFEAMSPPNERRQGCHHYADLATNLGFHPKTSNNTKSE